MSRPMSRRVKKHKVDVVHKCISSLAVEEHVERTGHNIQLNNYVARIYKYGLTVIKLKPVI